MSNPMNIVNSWCFVNSKHKILKFKPEKKIEPLDYDYKLWSRIFPKNANVNFKLLKLTNIGKYSAAKQHVSKLLITTLREFLNAWFPSSNLKNITITESNGGLGALTIILAKHSKKVNSVEIIKDHVDIIKNNVDQYKFSHKVNVVHADYMDVAYKLKQDIIVADPPWGGTDYYKISKIRLHLNNVDITCIINKLYEKKKFKIFVLLVPYNFDIKLFMEKTICDTVCIKKYGGLYGIFIRGHS
jgi:tRNA/tmRNA/rRNA uracil-C5-methylase (TrmA/RlmC/RlmD family)